MGDVKLTICNIFDQDAFKLARFAREHCFEGVDWSFSLDMGRDEFLKEMEHLAGFELRFHCRFPGLDVAYADGRSDTAMAILSRMTDLSADAGGGHMTVHIGLGKQSDSEFDWDTAIKNLTELVEYGKRRGVVISLENLTTVWTSDPVLFAKLIAETGAGVTLDIGHAHKVEVDCRRFISPHSEKVVNAHIYHTEIPRMGHEAPTSLEQITGRLDVLASTPCSWWAIELDKPDEVLRTRDILSEYLEKRAKVAEYDLLTAGT